MLETYSLLERTFDKREELLNPAYRDHVLTVVCQRTIEDDPIPLSVAKDLGDVEIAVSVISLVVASSAPSVG